MSTNPAAGAAATKRDQVTITVGSGTPAGPTAGKDPGGC
jgi:hypothetical protein